MRLLHVNTLVFAKYETVPLTPPYAVLSHRWNEAEASLADVKNWRKDDRPTAVLTKVLGFVEYVRTYLKSVEYIWVDSCCINQESSAELSEGVNSMFDWYRNARVCLAYLHDVDHPSDQAALRKSVWFQRGWTLQELVASTSVVFLTNKWQTIGHKAIVDHLDGSMQVGPNLECLLSEVTKIPQTVLRDYSNSFSLTIEEKELWMEGRQTLKEEDMVYALFGIFGVAPGANYGEKKLGAKVRLRAAIEQKYGLNGGIASDAETMAWLSPPDPRANHIEARKLHEPGTCAWLLHHRHYKSWKAGITRHLWLYGKAGCGKSVLCSTVIEDLLHSYKDKANVGLAYFYFDVFDTRKQSYDNLLLSLVSQFMRREPARSLLRASRKASVHARPSSQELESILVKTITDCGDTLVVLDALDESPELDDVRLELLKRLSSLVLRTSKLRLFATSRYMPDICGLMEDLSSQQIPIQPIDVNDDIHRFMSIQLSTDWRLRDFTPMVRSMVEKKVSESADGMFRWAYLLLKQLRDITCSGPKDILAELASFPVGLDQVYARVLQEIKKRDQQHVLTLLYWIAYAREPLNLGELIDALTIEPEHEIVDLDNRCAPKDIFRLLSSLVIFIEPEYSEQDGIAKLSLVKKTKVRLAHFTVKEYLESTRIQEGEASHFFLEYKKGHFLLTKSCVTYIMHYSTSDKKTSTDWDLESFPLLAYAMSSWYHHSRQHESPNVTLEMRLLRSEATIRDWLRIRRPVELPVNALGDEHADGRDALYYASGVGLTSVVRVLLNEGAHVNARGAHHSEALHVASRSGHSAAVNLLLAHGAEPNAQSPDTSSALQIAAEAGHADIVRLLLSHGARPLTDRNNMTALHYSALLGREIVAQHMLASGISVDLPVSRRIWRAAVKNGKRTWNVHTDANGTELPGLTPLHYAALIGSITMVKFLIDSGADTKALSAFGESALHFAIKRRVNGPKYQDHWNNPPFTIEVALDHIVIHDDNENEYDMASMKIDDCRLDIIRTLLASPGSNVLAKDCHGMTPLHCVRYGTHHSTVLAEELLGHGADVTQRDLTGKSAIHLACANKDADAANLFIEHGGSIEDKDNSGMTALHYAAKSGDLSTISLMLEIASKSNLEEYVSQKDALGYNALHHLLDSVSYSEKSAVQRLTSTPIGVNDLSIDGHTPLALFIKRFLTRSKNKVDIINHLVAKGSRATLYIRGRNLGHLATTADEVGIELLECLFKHGVDLAAKDDDDRSILHHLALHGSLVEAEALNFLTDVVGLSTEDRDKYGETPLEIAFAKAKITYPALKTPFRPLRWRETSTLLATSRKHGSMRKAIALSPRQIDC